MPPFSDDVISAVLHHMNDEHRDDNLLIARAFGSTDATAATMTSLDNRGGSWRFTGPGGDHDLTVPWSEPISERAQIRREVVRLYDAACERLGIEPRPH